MTSSGMEVSVAGGMAASAASANTFMYLFVFPLTLSHSSGSYAYRSFMSMMSEDRLRFAISCKLERYFRSPPVLVENDDKKRRAEDKASEYFPLSMEPMEPDPAIAKEPLIKGVMGSDGSDGKNRNRKGGGNKRDLLTGVSLAGLLP